MQPQVRYVKSGDGTRLAVSTLGEGRPLVMVPAGAMTISIEGLWEIQEIRQNLERLAGKRSVVLYDSRGVGLSSREIEDFSLDVLVGDLEAVVESLESPIVDLFGIATGGLAAIKFAVNHPDRVRNMILSNSAARGRDFRLSSQTGALSLLMEENWELYRQTQALIAYGWTDVGRHWAQRLISDVSKDVHIKSHEELRGFDVCGLLPLVGCPTLVMHWRERMLPMEASREIAAAIPNARLLTFSQVGGSILSAAWDLSLGPAVAFLDEDLEPEVAPQLPEGTALILFADIVDSTALTERLGDAAFREKARGLDTSLRTIIRDNSGTPVDGKLVGDGVLAVFTSARQAIEAARASAAAGDAIGLPLHLGIHAGDVIREGKNVYGGAVNIAARIAAASAPGELLVSDTVRALARTSAGVTFADRGEQALKGIADPVRLFAVS